MKKKLFKPTIKIGRDISFKDFIHSRIVTPAMIREAFVNPAVPNNSISNILFNARYKEGKALEGYDFI